MTLYEIYDICDIAIEETTPNSRKSPIDLIIDKILIIFKHITSQFAAFCNNVKATVKNLKRKFTKGTKTKVYYVDDWEAERLRREKEMLDKLFSRVDIVVQDSTSQEETDNGVIDFEAWVIKHKKKLNTIKQPLDDLNKLNNDDQDTPTLESDKSYPFQIDTLVSMFNKFQEMLAKRMSDANKVITDTSNRLVQSVTKLKNRAEETSSSSKILQFAMKLGSMIYQVLLLPLHAILSALKFITSLFKD